MSKEICISSTPHETRLAILEDEQLTEVYYERENEYTLAGSIYKGRVTRVLPGMQSAFVDLGLERDAFLYVTDFMEEQEDSSDFERIPANGEETGRGNQGRENRGRDNQNREASQPRAAHTAAEEEPAPRRNGAPANGAPGGQAPGGEFEDGTRRWRGRRGRRKGFRPPQGGQQGARKAQPRAVQKFPGPSRHPFRRRRSVSSSDVTGRVLVARGVAFEVRRSKRCPDAHPAGRRAGPAAASQRYPGQALHPDRDPAGMER